MGLREGWQGSRERSWGGGLPEGGRKVTVWRLCRWQEPCADNGGAPRSQLERELLPGVHGPFSGP